MKYESWNDGMKYESWRDGMKYESCRRDILRGVEG